MDFKKEYTDFESGISFFVRDPIRQRQVFEEENEQKEEYLLEDIDLKPIGKFSSFDKAVEHFLSLHPEFDIHSIPNYITKIKNE